MLAQSRSCLVMLRDLLMDGNGPAEKSYWLIRYSLPHVLSVLYKTDLVYWQLCLFDIPWPTPGERLARMLDASMCCLAEMRS